MILNGSTYDPCSCIGSRATCEYAFSLCKAALKYAADVKNSFDTMVSISFSCRILEEQFQKSERLEELQVQMEQELLEERQKREDLEELKGHQEELLFQEKEQLERLEQERKANEQRLDVSL